MPNGKTITYWAPKTGVLGGAPFEPPVFVGGQLYGDTLDDVDEVYLNFGNGEVQERGYLALGEISSEDPREIPGAREITSISFVPCLRTLRTKQVAILS